MAFRRRRSFRSSRRGYRSSRKGRSSFKRGRRRSGLRNPGTVGFRL